MPSPLDSTKDLGKRAVADSWEDEDLSDDASEQPSSNPSAASAPQPAPSSANYGPTGHEWASMSGSTSASPSHDTPAKRPEKTDAVARRMIAAGLGLKAPKQTEEQKVYQMAIREQEKKKREQERAEEQRRRELAEKAKAAIWDD